MTESHDNDNQQYVTFSLGNELFGVGVGRTREILSLIEVTAVPQTPDYMLGVINLRGHVVPVVDMRLKLGMPPAAEQTQDTCIIVLEIQVDDDVIVVGAQADAVREVLEIQPGQIEPPPKLGTRLKTEFIHGMGKVNGQFIILLNIDRVFSGDDLDLSQDMAELSDAVQEASYEELADA